MPSVPEGVVVLVSPGAACAESVEGPMNPSEQMYQRAINVFIFVIQDKGFRPQINPGRHSLIRFCLK